MARVGEKLSRRRCSKVKTAGMYGDGHGLWLHVGAGAADPKAKQRDGKSWIFRYMIDGRAREMGLGPLVTIGLSEARESAQKARRLVDWTALILWTPSWPSGSSRSLRPRRPFPSRNVPPSISLPTAPAGATPSTRCSGTPRSPHTPIRRSVNCLSGRSPPGTSPRCWNRSGRRDPKRHLVCVGASRRS